MAVVVVVAAIAALVVVHPWRHDGSTRSKGRASTDVADGSAGSQVDMTSVLGQLPDASALGAVRADGTPAERQWHVTSQRTAKAGDPTVLGTRGVCVPKPEPTGLASRGYSLDDPGGGIHGSAHLTVLRFSSADEAERWATAHTDASTDDCEHRLHASILLSELKDGRILNDQMHTPVDVQLRMPVLEYTASYTQAGVPCTWYENSFWKSQGDYVLAADFTTCQRELPESAESDLVAVVAAQLAKQPGGT